MFAIQDVHGNVVGFTGRLLNPDAKEAKYVNTPETSVYKKSAVLYALDKAKGEIKSKDLCVIVEGNMDALSSHRVGISNVVASSGTALTAEQLKLISRFTKHISIAFDADAAGMAAALRGLDLARAQDFDIRVITLPEDAGKDPDDAIAKDPEIWKRAITEATEIMDWIFRSAFKGRNLSDPAEKREIAKSILPEIRRIADPIIRDHWIKKFSEALETSEQALRDALRQTKHTNVTQQNTPEQQKDAIPQARERSRRRELAEQVLSLILLRPSFLQHIPVQFGAKLDPDLSTVYTEIVSRYDSGRLNEAPAPADLSSTPDPSQSHERLIDYLAIRADRDYQNQTENGLTAEFNTSLAAFLTECRAFERKQIEEEMHAAELVGDQEKIQSLARRFHELM
jgi:DNA primase